MSEGISRPIFFVRQLIREKYLKFSSKEIENFAVNIPLANSVGVFIMQDSAPPHKVKFCFFYFKCYGEKLSLE